MTSGSLILQFLKQFYEVIVTATVIVATSMLLYNLSNNFRDRVTRCSGVLLACVTGAFIGKVLISITSTETAQDAQLLEIWLRLQWVGIAFAPAALFHLSDALLSTTGVISRGRRRRVVRLLYLYGLVFFVVATLTNLFVHDVIVAPIPVMQAGPLLWLYLLYFVGSSAFAIRNVVRARDRCLTKATRRRMTYLLLVFPTPVLGIFPYSLMLPLASPTSELLVWLILNLGNIGIVTMLIFMAYPLSFFGSTKPDRVVKADLLRFILRGPVIGVMVLLVILFVPKTEFIGLPGTAIMPFAAVTTVLVMQWASTLIIPILERRLIYTDDQDQAQKIEEFSNRLLTETDARQLLEATLAAICDYLRVSSAFIVSLKPDGAHLEQVVGSVPPAQSWLDSPDFSAMATDTTPTPDSMRVWQSFWLVPLRSTRLNGATDGGGRQIGMMGVWARAVQPDLTHDEMTLFKALHTRAARVLDDMLLEEEIFNLVEDVLGRLPNDRVNAKELALGDKSKITLDDSTKALIESPEFLDSVRLALKDLWGGVGLTDSPLIKLRIVVRALPENENNASRALRAVILQAFENLKPEGQRSLTAASWAIYNILDFRFKDGKKVRETANRLAMSEPDLYRKQRYAIEQVAAQIKEMEQRELNSAVH